MASLVKPPVQNSRHVSCQRRLPFEDSLDRVLSDMALEPTRLPALMEEFRRRHSLSKRAAAREFAKKTGIDWNSAERQWGRWEGTENQEPMPPSPANMQALAEFMGYTAEDFYDIGPGEDLLSRVKRIEETLELLLAEVRQGQAQVPESRSDPKRKRGSAAKSSRSRPTARHLVA